MMIKIHDIKLANHQFSSSKALMASKGANNTLTNKSSMPSKNARILVIFTAQKYKKPG